MLRHKIAQPLGFEGEEGLFHIADGIITIAVDRMAASIRKISVERGLDPREFSLLAYGGGGPLHASSLAATLDIPSTIVPPEPGNFSATGMLLANPRMDEARTFLSILDEGTIASTVKIFAEMKTAATKRFSEEGNGDIIFNYDAEMRYRGQKHSIRINIGGLNTEINLRQAFSEEYRRRYGHADESAIIEFVGLHLGAVMETEKPDITRLVPLNASTIPAEKLRQVWLPQATRFTKINIFQRSTLPHGFEGKGPAIIEEYGSTTMVGENDYFVIGDLGEIRISNSTPIRGNTHHG